MSEKVVFSTNKNVGARPGAEHQALNKYLFEKNMPPRGNAVPGHTALKKRVVLFEKKQTTPQGNAVPGHQVFLCKGSILSRFGFDFVDCFVEV